MAKKAKKAVTEKEAPAKPERQPRVRVVRTEEPPPEAPPVDDSGLSLEDLGQAYAALLNRGSVPYEEPVPEVATPIVEDEAKSQASEDVDGFEPSVPEVSAPDDALCELSPKTILEAMLFVGHPDNEPLTAKQVASLMRGVRTDEIDELVRELNQQYEAERTPYSIVSDGAGYQMTLRDEFISLRENFYGKVKEARLTQPAIDTLAIVAYNQPVTQKTIDELRGKPSGSLLGQLTRRQLIQIERPPESPKEVLYRTTSRFLDLFSLDSLDDLPRAQEIAD